MLGVVSALGIRSMSAVSQNQTGGKTSPGAHLNRHGPGFASLDGLDFPIDELALNCCNIRQMGRRAEFPCRRDADVPSSSPPQNAGFRSYALPDV